MQIKIIRWDQKSWEKSMDTESYFYVTDALQKGAKIYERTFWISKYDFQKKVSCVLVNVKLDMAVICLSKHKHWSTEIFGFNQYNLYITNNPKKASTQVC